MSYTAYDSNKKEIKGEVKVPSAGYVDVKVTNDAQDYPKSLTIMKKFKVNDDKDANTAPDAAKFDNATFTLYQKGEKDKDKGFEVLYADIPYSAFEGTDGSKYYTFEKLDPTKTYMVIEKITSKTDGGSSMIPYTGTGYTIGSDTSSTKCVPATDKTSGSTLLASGEITLQEVGGEQQYHSNTVTFINEYKSPSVDVEFTKVDADHPNTGLEGAKFALYADSTAKTAYPTTDDQVIATSDGYGKVTFKELPYDTVHGATYYMKEIQAPSGYVLDNSTIYTISITVNGTEVTTRILKADGSEISDLKIKNTAIETELTFYKKSKTKNGTEISLDGAVFEIKRLEGSEYKKVTDIIGVDSTKSQFTIPAEGIKLTKIKDGTYQIREITAPAGYNLLTEPISFVIENGLLKQSKTASEVVTLDPANKTVIIYNTAGIELPETGGMGTLMTTMSGMALMLIALGYLILVKRREKGGLN